MGSVFRQALSSRGTVTIGISGLIACLFSFLSSGKFLGALTGCDSHWTNLASVLMQPGRAAPWPAPPARPAMGSDLRGWVASQESAERDPTNWWGGVLAGEPDRCSSEGYQVSRMSPSQSQLSALPVRENQLSTTPRAASPSDTVFVLWVPGPASPRGLRPSSTAPLMVLAVSVRTRSEATPAI